jgi:hypothetical protein
LLKRFGRRNLIKHAILFGGLLGAAFGFAILLLTDNAVVSDFLDEHDAFTVLLMAVEFLVLPMIVAILVAKFERHDTRVPRTP